MDGVNHDDGCNYDDDDEEVMIIMIMNKESPSHPPGVLFALLTSSSLRAWPKLFFIDVCNLSQTSVHGSPSLGVAASLSGNTPPSIR